MSNDLNAHQAAPAAARDALGVISELDAALGMLVSGLKAVFPAEDQRTEITATLQHLASGLERLLKLTYVQAVLEATGERPSPRDMRAYSHNVLRLVDGLLDVVEDATEYVRRPAVQDDLRFMREDGGLRGMLTVLSAFGAEGRYAVLDGLLDSAKASPDSDPSRQWQEIEVELLERRADWPSIIESQHELDAAAAFEVAGRLQRLTRALARMWTLGALGDSGPQHCGALGPILYISDEDLGVRPPR